MEASLPAGSAQCIAAVLRVDHPGVGLGRALAMDGQVVTDRLAAMDGQVTAHGPLSRATGVVGVSVGRDSVAMATVQSQQAHH